MTTHPLWCAPTRCSAGSGAAGMHRSEPFEVPAADGATARLGLWQPLPTEEMPHPATYTEVIEGLEHIAPNLTRLADRRRERRVVRAQIRDSLTTLTASTRRAAA